jgi:Holliday junction resolvase RusA-like endonuclease
VTAPLDIRFAVYGTPVPKGNHAAFPIARGKCGECKPGARCRRRNCFGGTIVGTVVSDDKGSELEAWQQMINVSAMSARNKGAMRLVEAPGALEVSIVFMLERPAGHWTSRGALSADGQRKPLPTVKPDWDKLSRAVADGLTGALCTDDNQIVIAHVAKIYAPKAGVVIAARAVTESAGWVAELLGSLGIATATATQGGLF